jgi:hypothetical protein
MSGELGNTKLRTDANLQGYWKLNGNFTDSSVNGYNLTASASAPGDVLGMFGNAKDFERDSAQYAAIAHASCPNLEITGSQSWLAWVKPETIGGGNYLHIMAKTATANNRAMQVSPTGTARVHFTGLATTPILESDLTMSNGNWYFVCAVYDSANTKIKIWFNGTKKEATASGTMTASNQPFQIGGYMGGSECFDGVIDECAVFNRALTDTEVLNYYNGWMNNFLELF